MKPPNNESVAYKDFEQLRRGDWLMRLTRNEINVYRRVAKITPIEFTTKPTSRRNIDYKRIENMPPFYFKTRPMRTGNIDYSSSDRITQVEFRTKRMNKGNSAYSGSDRITRVEFEEDRRRRPEVYRQKDAVRCNDRQQELHDLQNTREKYLSNGWRTTEQPLHQQQWVQNEMAKFHSSINSLEHRDNVLHARKLGLQNRV